MPAYQRGLFDEWEDDVDGPYRYLLGHRFAEGPTALWGMLNPSTAIAGKHDTTTTRIEGYSRNWGFGAWLLVNAMAYRDKDPKRVAEAAWSGIDVVGPRNREAIAAALARADAIVVGWGAYAWTMPVVEDLVAQLRSAKQLLWCVKVTKSGDPIHPVRQPYGPPRVWMPKDLLPP